MKPTPLTLLIIVFLCSCTDNRITSDIYNSGVDKYNSGDYNSALKEFKLCLEREVKNPNAFYYKGLCEVKSKNDSSALISFQNAIRLDSSYYQALVERAKLKISLGDYRSALNDCDKAMLLRIDYSELYKTKASAYEFINDASNALIAYESAIKYGENNGETYYKFGMLLMNNGNNDKACTLLSKAGELGYMLAFKIIKSNCNQNGNFSLNNGKSISSTAKDSFNWNKEYRSPKYGYSIKIPESYKEVKGNRPHIDFKFIDAFGSIIIVNVSPRRSEEFQISAHDYTKEILEETFRQETPNLSITYTEKIFVSGEKAFLTETENNLPNIKGMDCYFYHNDLAFLVTGTCEIERFPNYRNLFKNCILSVSL